MVVLSVIIGQETEVVGVRTCLTWKPLSVLNLMGRPKQGRLGALSLPPSTPQVSGTTVALSSAELQSGVWNTPQPPPSPDPSILVQLFLIIPPPPTPRCPNHLSLTPQTPTAPTPPSARPLLLQACSLAKLSCV